MFTQPKSINDSNWNVHVNKDLTPYICLTHGQSKLQDAPCLAALWYASSKFRFQWNWKYLIFGFQNVGYATRWDKGDENNATIQWCHKNGKQKFFRMDFAGVIWLESDLSDTYLQRQKYNTILAGRPLEITYKLIFYNDFSTRKK